MYDLIIIGSGPAGLGAAIYAEQARLNTLVIEKAAMSGGQILLTEVVDNYPGIPSIGGFELGQKLREHAEQQGEHFVTYEITCVDFGADHGYVVKTLRGKKQEYQTRALIVAAGASHKKLGVPGEDAYIGRGVSYCAVCDGAFYRGLDAVVVGGGNIAAEDALYLSRFCRSVRLIHRRDALRASAILQEQLKQTENIEILWNTVVEEICGGSLVESVKLRNRETGESRVLPANGVFVAVGINANSEIFLPELHCESGFIAAAEDCVTNIPGVFAAGDIRTKKLRQVVTAVSDGASAVSSAEEYLRTL